jgi:anaerobic selenocysteine-containing dehydrogenase
VNKLTRRDFLKIGAIGLASAVLAGCQRPRRWVNLEPYVRPPEEQLAGIATWYASTCRQCPAGCGIIVRVMNGRALKIEGNPEHPLNRGKLCARGQAGLQVLYNPDRLSGPAQQAERGSRHFRPISWEEGLNTLYARLQQAGSGTAIWVGSTISAHLLDLFERFTTATDAPSPLVFDLYSEVNGLAALKNVSREIFGEPRLPTYDLGQADIVLSFGADFLGTWLSPVRYGTAFGAFRSQPLGKRGYLVQLEPRMSITGAKADWWLPVSPGSEALVAQALARIIADGSLGPAERAAAANTLAGEVDVSSVAAASGISVEELEQLAHIFATATRPLAIPGNTLAAQDGQGTAIAAVQVLNAIAGADGLGGLALSHESSSPALLRPKASSFGDVQALIERMQAGDVQVLLVHGANPAYELPESARFVDALANVPFVVSFSPIADETGVQADLVLPDRTYLESWGYAVVSPGFDLPVVGSQQPVVTPVFDARSTGDVLLTVVRGIPAAAAALPWADEVAFLKEAIRQLPAGAAGGSGPDVLWSRFLQHGGWWPASIPSSPSPSPTLSQAIQVTPTAFQGDEQEYPYFLHLYLSDLLSDGRGASQPWLQGSPDPMTTMSWQTWVELHPSTAQRLGVRDGDVVQVASLYGEIEAPVYTYPAIRPDTVAIPIGQGHTDYGRYARERGSNPMRLVGAQTGAAGGNLAWATLRVKITPTGKRVSLAVFENKAGVAEGFVNEAFPGQ